MLYTILIIFGSYRHQKHKFIVPCQKQIQAPPATKKCQRACNVFSALALSTFKQLKWASFWRLSSNNVDEDHKWQKKLKVLKSLFQKRHKNGIHSILWRKKTNLETALECSSATKSAKYVFRVSNESHLLIFFFFL